ncbi:hypothetical protein KXX16_008906 [Aspergillus fumigatus]|nr:hypothetical protein KXX64_005668 [Aspergillus fumigatus]KAH1559259.1 hypothetical protein KXX17_006166 [Aspergillus fumigatus]KAH1648196.1 hypothetical protein KXX16_008906 [Aspergillus fumigatus]KAH1747966.1 hypothetical protein KXX41_000483 [Aspergillus fumigatus]KAH1863148.1 hypothetical protein KXX01_002993 [Aspergillus fumigatus]
MPHSVPLSDSDSSGPLVGSLTALSLTATPETETVDAEPSQYNPFIPYLGNEVGTSDAVRFIDQLIRDAIPRHLAELRQTRRFELAESYSLYIRGRQFQERWGASEASFFNWKELLSGWIDFPAMVDQSTTLTWVEDSLQPAKLTLSDVIIFDMFPMVRDDILKCVEEADRLVLVQESFALTVECLRRIRPRRLCSSVAGAQSGLVRGVDVGGHRMHVVQGMHPHYVVRQRPDLERVLQELFVRVFRGFGAWKSHRMATRKALWDAARVISGLLFALQQQLQLYRQMCQRAQEYGIDGPVAVGRVEELQSQLDGW